MIIVIKFFFPPRNFSSKIGINSMFQRLDRIVQLLDRADALLKSLIFRVSDI